ncbi:MAG TPA: arginine--tRNA ligase, partial [Daejeonella sp.]|nr:arginine--tRNA ligase [Daejeonella sp.]
MMLENKIVQTAQKAVQELYHTDLPSEQFTLQETRKEFEGQITLVTFPLTRSSKKSPEQTGQEIGAYLQQHVDEVVGFNVIKGFLNLSIADGYWVGQLHQTILKPEYGTFPSNGKKVMVEYSSPNTNKPLH